jgi:hypothetical protein
VDSLADATIQSRIDSLATPNKFNNLHEEIIPKFIYKSN